MHGLGFGRLGRLGGLWGDGRRRGQVLAPGTGSEDVDVLDFATLELRWVGTGGTDLQVDFLNPPE